MPTTLPTEPIGSVPRPPELLKAIKDHESGKVSAATLERAYDAATEDTIRRFEGTGSPIITDGEQRKPSFATYPVTGGRNITSGGLVVTFSDLHTRILPRLTAGPFRYQHHAAEYVRKAKGYTDRPIKQAVISASLLSTLYPKEPMPGYSRDAFIEDLVQEVAKDIIGSFEAGAKIVQLDFTEAPLAVKLDPSGKLLRDFVALNNEVLRKVTPIDRKNLGVHVCKGGDRDATHSAEVDYARVLPGVFELDVPNLYFATAGEPNPELTFRLLGEYAKGKKRIFVGVTNPISRVAETPAAVEKRILSASKHIDVEHLGTTDDCGFAPFSDDTSTSRELAFAKIRARVDGTRLAARKLLR
jgi:5-methyltetrahydropteroyltriglutamate--homocysteine methyltransferase